MKDAGRIGFVIRGPYSALAQYEFLDIVYYGDASYVAKKDVSGVTPEDESEYWQAFAKGRNSPSEITITVDAALDETSENPVQNKAVVGALAEKGDSLDYDDAAGKLRLKSGETVISETEVGGGSGGGAETEPVQSWGSGNVIGNGSGIAVGDNNVIASGAKGSAAFGGHNKVNAPYAFSAGLSNELSAAGSVAFGMSNVMPASGGVYMFAAGRENEPTESYSSTLGVSLRQWSYGGLACGRWNAAREAVGNGTEARGDAFIVGNGSSNARANALRVSYSGDAYALKAVNSSGADYAEFIKPWADGNPDNEDRVGYFVTVREGLLYKANAGDYIVGVTSGNPSVVGNADEDYYWKYERDAFGRIALEEVTERVQALDDKGGACVR